MGLFSFFRKDSAGYFSEAEKEAVLDAIRKAEQRTSGEVRIFVERKCRFVNPVDRAYEIFYLLKMDKTDHHNAVLVYLAMKDRQFAIFADEGIYTAVGREYWNREANEMLHAFKQENYARGLVTVIADIGEALHEHFPYDPATDKNELPDDIVFGK